MSEWKTYRLGDIIQLKSGGTPDKSNPDYWGGPIPWISAKSMYDDFISTSDLFITEEGLQAGSKIAKKDSILLLTRGSGLFNRIPVCYVVSDVAYNQDVKNIVLKQEDVTSIKFLYYWLYGNKELLSSMLETTGIGAGKIDTKRFLNLSISLPSQKEQARYIHLMDLLFDKIELNRRINANLEAQAQALFRSWFVDFEPFRDGPFVDSQLGKIPNDFQIIKTGEIPMIITDFVANGSFASLKDNVTILQEKDYAYFIRNVDLKDKKFETYVNKHAYEFLSKSALFGNEIIISNVGDVGSVFLCPKLDRPMTLGNNIIMLRPKESQMLYYLYIWFKWFQGQSLIQGIKSGSAQPKFNKTDFKNLPIILPPRTTLRAFHSIIEPFFNKINFLTHENQTLSALRDTLLPKLIAGEIAIE